MYVHTNKGFGRTHHYSRSSHILILVGGVDWVGLHVHIGEHTNQEPVPHGSLNGRISHRSAPTYRLYLLALDISRRGARFPREAYVFVDLGYYFTVITLAS